MSPHGRRILVLRLAIAALALALPACWAAGRVRAAGRWIRYRRNRRRRRIPGLDLDGERLTIEEAIAFVDIARGWKHKDPASVTDLW